jgi:hypothetical protein
MTDHEHAARAAQEEAHGAGVVRFSLYVTATALAADPDQLSRLVSTVETSTTHAKLRLRRLWGSQAAGFAATLPLGICPPALAVKHPR